MNDNDLGILSLTAQIRGEYLTEIKQLARESYLRREIGTADEFEHLWRQAFDAESDTTEKG